MTVYVIQCGEQPFVKIGSSLDPDRRCRDLQTGHYEVLHIIRTVPGGLPTEIQFRERFRRFHRRNEWYHFQPEMLTFQPASEATIPPDRAMTKTQEKVFWAQQRRIQRTFSRAL